MKNKADLSYLSSITNFFISYLSSIANNYISITNYETNMYIFDSSPTLQLKVTLFFKHQTIPNSTSRRGTPFERSCGESHRSLASKRVAGEHLKGAQPRTNF
jgi:hypothetical protein